VIPHGNIVKQIGRAMNPERWGQIERLYHAALEREPKDRDKFLADACEGDTELRSELESLLAQTKTTEEFLEKPAIEFGAPLLVDDCAGQHRIDTDRPRADFGWHETEHARRRPRPPWWMYLIAASFLAHAFFMTAFCFYGPESMGVDVRPATTKLVISNVAKGSPAERAGIRRGDILVRANDRFIPDINYWYWFLTNVEIGRPIMLEADRGGQHVHAAFALDRRAAAYWSTGAGMILLLNICGQFTALAVACFLAFLRPRHLYSAKTSSDLMQQFLQASIHGAARREHP
jgi:hypothetical protein